MTTKNFVVKNGLTTGNITLDAASGNIDALNAEFSNLVIANLFTGTLTTSAQPNITSVGTLTSLSVSGNLSAGNASLGNLASANFFSGDGSNLTNIKTGEVLSNGTYLLGGNFDGSAARTWTVDATSASTANKVVARDSDGSFSANVITANLTGTASNAALADEATKLATARNINGEEFDGTANITITANTAQNLTPGNFLLGNNFNGGTARTFDVDATSANTASKIVARDSSGNFSAGNITAAGLTVTGAGSFSGNLAMNNFNITGLAGPVATSDAATKAYVDEVAQGLKTRTAANVKADSPLSADYDNGSAGVGATLTATANGAFPAIDGITLSSVGDRVLVAAQSNAAHNGLYVLDVVGNGSTKWQLRRCNECSTAEQIPGSFVFVKQGTEYEATGWVAIVDDPSTFVVGTSAINWTQFSGAGTFIEGPGIEIDGLTISANVDGVTTAISNGNIVVKNQANLVLGNVTFDSLSWSEAGNGLVSANTLFLAGNASVGANLDVNGAISSNSNISGTNFSASGNVIASANVVANNVSANTLLSAPTGNITTINSGLLQNGTSNVVITANSNVSIGVAGTNRIIATTSGANIAGTLGVTENITAPNFIGNLAGSLVNGNSSISIPSTNGNIILNAAGGTAELVITSTGINVAGTLNATGNANVGNLGTGGAITATGNVTGGNLSTGGAITATGNVIGGNLSTGGTLNVTGNANVGNIGTGRVIATGNISGTQLISNVSTGTAPLVVTSTTRVNNLNVARAGVADVANNVAGGNVVGAVANAVHATTANTVVDADQSNITSVGTLTGLEVSGNVQVGPALVVESVSTTTTSTAQTVLYSFPVASYETARVVISATQGGERHSTELLVTHNSSDAFATEYAIVTTDDDLFSVEVDVNNANVRILTTSASSSSTSIKAFINLVAV